MANGRFRKAEDDGSADSLQLQEFVSSLTAGQSRIRAFIVSLVPGSAAVDDILQETNLALWNSRKRYRPGSNFIAWAFTIARFEVLHHIGREKRRGAREMSGHLMDLLVEEASSGKIRENYIQALEVCKSKLTGEQRELIDHRYEEGKSLESYAQQTGRNPGALRVALMRIRILLRDCVERQMEGGAA